MRTWFLPVLPALVLAGCAAPPQQGEQQAKTVVCHREKPTGLAHYVKVCRDVALVGQREKESKELMDNMRQGPATDATLGR